MQGLRSLWVWLQPFEQIGWSLVILLEPELLGGDCYLGIGSAMLSKFVKPSSLITPLHVGEEANLAA